MVLESLSNATVDVFSARQPFDFPALRLRLACSDGLLQGNFSALESLAASAGLGINAASISTLATTHANRAMAKRDMMHLPSFGPL
jgi:hypothetical protein